MSRTEGPQAPKGDAPPSGALPELQYPLDALQRQLQLIEEECASHGGDSAATTAARHRARVLLLQALFLTTATVAEYEAAAGRGDGSDGARGRCSSSSEEEEGGGQEGARGQWHCSHRGQQERCDAAAASAGAAAAAAEATRRLPAPAALDQHAVLIQQLLFESSSSNGCSSAAPATAAANAAATGGGRGGGGPRSDAPAGAPPFAAGGGAVGVRPSAFLVDVLSARLSEDPRTFPLRWHHGLQRLSLFAGHSDTDLQTAVLHDMSLAYVSLLLTPVDLSGILGSNLEGCGDGALACVDGPYAAAAAKARLSDSQVAFFEAMHAWWSDEATLLDAHQKALLQESAAVSAACLSGGDSGRRSAGGAPFPAAAAAAFAAQRRADAGLSEVLSRRRLGAAALITICVTCVMAPDQVIAVYEALAPRPPEPGLLMAALARGGKGVQPPAGAATAVAADEAAARGATSGASGTVGRY